MNTSIRSTAARLAPAHPDHHGEVRWILAGAVAIAISAAGVIGLVQASAPPAAQGRPAVKAAGGTAPDTGVPDAARRLQNAPDEAPAAPTF